MKILDRYIGRTIIASVSLVLLILVALFTFFDFVDELEGLGEGSYGLEQIIMFLLLRLPRLCYEMMPMAALVGTLMGLGMLVSNGEMAVIRAAGVSLNRIVFSVMKSAVIIMMIALIIGEFISPYTEQQARNGRSIAKADQIAMKSKYGFWARDGQSYINIRKILPGDRVEQIFIYEFDGSNRLRVSTSAQSAQYQEGKWLLEGIKQTEISDDEITSREIKQASWDSLLKPELLNVVLIKPENLSLIELGRYLTYLRDNNQNTLQYEQAMWIKMFYPLATAVMVFLAIPIVLGKLKSATVGRKVMLGCLIGLIFHIVNQASGQMGMLFEFYPILSAGVPTILTFVIGLFMLRRQA